MRYEIIPYNPELKELARKLRSNMTLGEVMLWKELKGKALLGFDFDRQKPIDNYIVDFYCNELKLVIEIDGYSHDIEEIAINDEKREGRLKELGLHIIRFKEIEVRKDVKKVLSEIEKWVGRHIKS